MICLPNRGFGIGKNSNECYIDRNVEAGLIRPHPARWEVTTSEDPFPTTHMGAMHCPCYPYLQNSNFIRSLCFLSLLCGDKKYEPEEPNVGCFRFSLENRRLINLSIHPHRLAMLTWTLKNNPFFEKSLDGNFLIMDGILTTNPSISLPIFNPAPQQ